MVIPASLIEEIVSAAKSSSVEICGLLFGERSGEEIRVIEAKAITNRLKSPEAFEMEPLEMVKVIDDAEGRGLEVVGIFHSHLKCPPRPSERDLEGMKNWRVPWLIIDDKENYGAFVLEGEKVREVDVRVV